MLASAVADEAVIRELRDRIDLLKAERAWLKDLLRSPGFLPAIFPLTASEERFFKALLRRKQCAKSDLLPLIYTNARNPRDIPKEKIMDVILLKVRRKLEPLGIEIESSKSGGILSISSEMRARVFAIIESERQREADEAAELMGRAA